MASKGISAKQQEILDFLKEEILQKGYPPTVREICERVKLKSTSSVHAHLETLEKAGCIRRDPTKPRAIEIMDDDFGMCRRETMQIPIVGRVAAGEPILAEQNIEGYFPFPAGELPRNDGGYFMLQVRGESMINAGILDGDHIIVAASETASNGEIVVALVEDSATVKRFYREKGYYRLQPENDEMEPILVNECRIVGKVVALTRMMH